MRTKPRWTGVTTKQLNSLPRGGMFVWCQERTEYPVMLAKALDQGDIAVVGPSAMENPSRFSGLSIPGIAVDHAAHLTDLQRDGLEYLKPLIGRK